MPDWTCSASRSYPVNEDQDWDGGAAQGRLWDHFKWDGNEPPSESGGSTRQAFLLYDADNPGLKGSYSLPFCDVVDGRVMALASGLRAAASRLPQKDGVSDDESSKARDVLDAYFAKIHENGQDARPEEDRDSGILLARATLARAVGVDVSKGYPPELLAHVYDQDSLAEHPLFVSRATASTSKVDTFGTSMLPSSLGNFADDADNGLAIQNSHRTDELPLGRTWQGRHVAKGTGGPRTDMDFYIPLNLNVNGVDTNHVVDGIRTGIVRDVSVGFYGGNVRCSLCSKEMMTDLFSLLFFGGGDDSRAPDPETPCFHLPGLEYMTFDNKGEPTGDRKVAVGQIDGAHCAELSLVFDGATPGAVINGRRSVAVQKAERMYEMGVLGRSTAHTLQTRYRGLRWPSLAQKYGGVTLPPSRATESDRPSPPQPTEAHAMPTAPNNPSSTAPAAAAVEGGAPPHAEPSRAPLPASPTAEQTAEAATALAAEAVSAAAPEPVVRHRRDDDEDDQQAGEPEQGNVQPTGLDNAERGERAGAVLSSIRSAFIAAGIAPAEFASADSRAVLTRVAEIGHELSQLRSSHDGYTKLRDRLVTQIRAEGVRAYGPKGIPDAVAGPILEGGSIDQLIGLLEFAEEQAGRRFVGGRATKDEPDPSPAHTDTRNGRHAPDAAFLAR